MGLRVSPALSQQWGLALPSHPNVCPEAASLCSAPWLVSLPSSVLQTQQTSPERCSQQFSQAEGTSGSEEPEQSNTRVSMEARVGAVSQAEDL